ncbi:MAG: hypothetical protein LBT25_00575 [Candidatus Symbiothrix sp.]|nr:hypothetical protein [Candidatus Symbiothrix sp.]
MLKKWTGIGLIIAANILLLAYSVLPHHHHEGIPHFTSHHADAKADCHSCCCHHGTSETCLFEQKIDVLYETKDDCACLICATHHHYPHPGILLQAVLLTFTYNFSLIWEESPLKEPPYLISYRFKSANAGLGLRAPPFC